MTQNRLMKAFLLAAPIALGGCQTVPYANKDTCTSWDEGTIRIPLIADLGSTGKAVKNASCNEGRMIGYSALLGRNSDGTLHPASIITWNKYYQQLSGKISAYDGEEIRDAKTRSEFNALAQTRLFADFFIEEASQKQVTSAIAKSMYDMKLTDPALFSPDGTYNPPAPVVPAAKTEYCSGTGMFRVCSKPTEPALQ